MRFGETPVLNLKYFTAGIEGRQARREYIQFFGQKLFLTKKKMQNFLCQY